MSEVQASSSKPARPTWDKEEWSAKAKEKDEAQADGAKDSEDAPQAKRQRYHPADDMAKPTKELQMRTEDLGLHKNLNKTILVTTTTTGKGPRGAGFYCDLCNQTFKDTMSYLDHINGRLHLKMLGQTTHVGRSTLAQVRAKIASLREQTATKVTAKNYDFAQRLASVRASEDAERAQRREDRKRKREERREGQALGKMGLEAGAEEQEVKRVQEEQQGFEAMMGFGGFGGKKKR